MRCSAYRLPPPGIPFRLVFVGQSTFFEACSLADELAPEFATAFVEYRAGADPQAMLTAVGSLHPHAVVVFRPELVPPSLFEHLDALTIGFLTEPYALRCYSQALEARAGPDIGIGVPPSERAEG